MPISIPAKDDRKPNSKRFALFAIDSLPGSSDRKRLTLIGYVKAKGQHVGEVLDRMQWPRPLDEHLNEWAVGRLLTKEEVFDRLAMLDF